MVLLSILRGLVLTCLGLVLGTGRSCHCARILLSSDDGSGSHFLVLSTIGQGLVDRGHHVTALISEANNDKATNDRYSHLGFDIFHDSTIGTTKNWTRWVMKHLLESRKSLFGNLSSVSPRAIYGLLKRCGDLLSHALERKRQGVRYDLLVIDAHKWCSVFLAGVLDTPYVFVVPSGIKPSLARRYGTSDTTAYFPEMSSGLPHKMSFWQRFSNTLIATSEDISVFFTYDVCYFLFSLKFSFSASISHVLSGAQLILINSDFAVDFPFPLQPNAITVGGLTIKPVKQLNEEWTDLMSTSLDHGVVLFTLGTYVDSVMTLDDMEMFARAFSSLKQTVIWQTKQPIPPSVHLTPNIRITPWIPQNDLLGHPSVRLLVFHGGNNGMYEAVYHGVPMVVIPMVLDTVDVGARVVQRGMGLSLDYFELTSKRLTQATETVLNNPRYKANTKRASYIMRERPHPPLNRTVFWIEHILKYGDSYLRPSSADLYFWQMYLLDVYAAMLLLVFIAYRLLGIFLRLLRIYVRIFERFWKRNFRRRSNEILPFVHVFRGTKRQRVLLTACFISTFVCCLLFIFNNF